MSDRVLLGGADVHTNDGKRAGKIRDIFLGENHRPISLSVDMGRLSNDGRIVPVEQIYSGGAEVRLACGRDEFWGFPLNQRVAMTPGMPLRGPGVGVLDIHVSPPGSVVLKTGDSVYANNHHAGSFVGIISSDSYDLQKVLVEAHHLIHKRTVAVPAEYLIGSESYGIDLALTKEQLEGLSDYIPLAD